MNEMAEKLSDAVDSQARAEASPTVEGLQSSRRVAPPAPRRTDPELVTEDPATDDADVYGEGWPLVEEWRRLRAEPYQPRPYPVVADPRSSGC